MEDGRGPCDGVERDEGVERDGAERDAMCCESEDSRISSLPVRAAPTRSLRLAYIIEK